MPFTGPKQLSLIGSKYLISDLALFYDAGVSFDEFSHLRDGFDVTVTQVSGDGQPVNVVENRKPALALFRVSYSKRFKGEFWVEYHSWLVGLKIGEAYS